tara:strand:- start:250 stop:978 length:729 start_codon:yes stop_codon:yes gene_type:complete
MAYLKIKNKKDFISNFLGPISNLNETCILEVKDNKLISILASADSTIVCKGEVEIECDIETKINIPDIKKFIRVLEIIPTADIELNISSNNISYNKDGYKFRYHLLDDGIIKQPSLNIDKVNKLTFDTSFEVKENNLSTIFKGSSFATETSKIYLYEEGEKIYGELGDRNRHNSDNFVCVLSEEYNGSLPKALPINFDSFRLISFSGSKNIKFNVNTEMGVITCTFDKGDTSLIYIISALIN